MPVKKEKLLQKADSFAREKKYRKAINLYKQVIVEDPGDVRTRLRLSELLYQADRKEEALELLSFVANYYRGHGFLLKSVAVYKKMLEVDPAKTDLHQELAELYFQLGMGPDAIRQFKLHVKHLARQGRTLEALHVVRNMLELDQENVSDRLRLAEGFSSLGLIDEAAKEYGRVLGVLEKKGRLNEWGRVALRYLHHDPQDFGVRKKIIDHLLQQGDYHKALQHLYACLLAEPQNAELMEMTASCFDLLGQIEKAVVVLKTLASIYRQKGLAREAEEVLARILQLDPSDAQTRSALGIGDEEQDAKIRLDLEWEMPADYADAEIVGDEEAETVFEPPPVGEDFGFSEATLVEPISADMWKELDLTDTRTDAVDVGSIRKALDERKPLSPMDLERYGVILSPSDKDELDFFISSGLYDEALAVLEEVYARLEEN